MVLNIVKSGVTGLTFRQIQLTLLVSIYLLNKDDYL